MLELVLPRRCAGCGSAGQYLCETCRTVLATPPARVTPPIDPHVPVFALGPYMGAHRGVVLSMKERSNLVVRRHMGAVLRAALEHLQARGEIPHEAELVPAPTRAANARARGGDPVEAVCRATGLPTHPVLALRARTRDQSELGAAQRRANLSGSVQISAAPSGLLIAVDDVVTTGATLQASVEKLLAHGANVTACVVICVA